jgi:hypothetical protein
MRRHVIFAIISLQAGLATAIAQPLPAENSSPPPAANPAAAAKPLAPMDEPMPGDHWTYEAHDEILGTVKNTRETVITEVTPKDISTRFTVAGNNNTGSVIFDRSWNVMNRGEWRYTPNDGGGVRLPLAVGKTWSIKATDQNSKSGDSWNRSGTAKVVGQESVTTKAGTFDTFKIEASVTGRNVANPARMVQFTTETWYAPSIDHWVKRIYTTRNDGHLTDKNSEILTAYGRKQ